MSSKHQHSKDGVIGPQQLQQLIDASDLDAFATAARCLHEKPVPITSNYPAPAISSYLSLAWAKGLKLLLTGVSGSILDAPAAVLEPIKSLSDKTAAWFIRLAKAKESVDCSSQGDFSSSATQTDLANRVSIAQELTKAGKAKQDATGCRQRCALVATHLLLMICWQVSYRRWLTSAQLQQLTSTTEMNSSRRHSL